MKQLIITTVLLVAASLAACTPPAQPAATQEAEPTQTAIRDANEESEVRALVEAFGKRLQMVSLLAPNAAQDLETQYTAFVSRPLLETWMNDVSNAPGRMVSSPWPDRIEIIALEQEAPDRYMIDGFVVEVTSTEAGSGESANEIPIRIVVEKTQGHWLIMEYTEEP